MPPTIADTVTATRAGGRFRSARGPLWCRDTRGPIPIARAGLGTKMSYRQFLKNCFSDGDPKSAVSGGVTIAQFEAVLTDCEQPMQRLQAQVRDKSLPLFHLLGQADDLAAIETIAGRWRSAFDTVVVLGTGGSSLGGKTLYALSDVGFGPRKGAPTVHFVDNVDPNTLTALLAAVELPKTGFIAISKSGSTAETLAQFFIAVRTIDAKVGSSRVAKHFLVITEPKSSPLRRSAERLSIPVLDHDPGIGGRFAALSCVGLLPALIAGLDIRKIRAGAKEVLYQASEAGRPGDSMPVAGAAISIALLRHRKIGNTVMMPYIDRLAPFTAWWRQLWAESLGKTGAGTTPIPALGAVDQHSQLQLYLDGPKDKMFTVITAETYAEGPPISEALCCESDLNWLANRTLGDLLAAEARATAETLVRNGRPLRAIKLTTVDETVIGALMAHFMIETIIAADLLGVNAFDQPAVEEGKRLTRDYMAAMQ